MKGEAKPKNSYIVVPTAKPVATVESPVEVQQGREVPPSHTYDKKPQYVYALVVDKVGATKFAEVVFPI